MKITTTIRLITALCFLQVAALAAQGNQYKAEQEKPGFINAEDDAYMGVYLESISKEKAKSLGFENLYGSYIQKVIPGTPADRAGLKALDYIYGVDAYRTGAEQSISDILDRYHAGDRAILHLQRGQNRTKLDIIFGSRDEERRSIAVTPCQDPFLGVMKASQAPQKEGIVIKVVKGSTADEMNLEDGDEILRINGYKILDWSDLTSAINDTEVGEDIEVVAWRGSSRVKWSHPIQSRCAFEQAKQRTAAQLQGGEGNVFSNTEIRTRSGHSLISKSMDQPAVQQANQRYGLSLKTDQDLPVEGFYFSADFDEDELEVSFELMKRGPTRVRIYNTSGRAIYDFDLGDFSGTFKDRTNLLKNESGLYFLEVQQRDQSVVRKIEIQK